jgi:hypothetical protein
MIYRNVYIIIVNPTAAMFVHWYQDKTSCYIILLFMFAMHHTWIDVIIVTFNSVYLCLIYYIILLHFQSCNLADNFFMYCYVITSYNETSTKKYSFVCGYDAVDHGFFDDWKWEICVTNLIQCRSRWLHGPRHRSAAAWLLGSQVQILLRAWMLVSCVCMLCCLM